MQCEMLVFKDVHVESILQYVAETSDFNELELFF
jgi:hypothetical protein